MTNYPAIAHAEVLRLELEWLQAVLAVRFFESFGIGEPNYTTIEDIPVPDHSGKDSSYANFINTFPLNVPERMILILALTPHLKPELLDWFFLRNTDLDKRVSEIGGRIGNTHTGMLPTIQMALFILAGRDLNLRLAYWPWLGEDGRLFRAHVLKCPVFDDLEPVENKGLQVTVEYLEYFMTGRAYQPAFSNEFPAQRVTTTMDWEDVVLDTSTRQQLEEIRDWLTYGKILLEDLELAKQLKPGYKCLFYGPPGTGKTLTASLLGKSTGREVYRVDLAMVQSKYIGETEKNLSRVFDQAENNQWILFFDEADSLFGSRTEVTSANDRFANNSVGYLLQRMEDFSGVVILATNLKENIDKAFTRRFQTMIRFQLPGAVAREEILRKAFSKKMPLDNAQGLKMIAEKYEFSGGMAMNAVRSCTLWALKNNQMKISQNQLEIVLRKELKKDGIILK